jgi:alpha-mannosidase
MGVGVTVLGSLRLSLTAATALSAAHRPLAARVYQPLTVALASTQLTGGLEHYRTEHRMAGSRLAGADGWSEAMDLMTLQQLEDDELLLRVSHRFALGEDAALSQPQCVNLSSLLPPATTLKEVSLTTNQNISALRQRQVSTNWKVAGRQRVDASERFAQQQSAVESDCEAHVGVTGGVLLQPMQVRTFMLSPL